MHIDRGLLSASLTVGVGLAEVALAGEQRTVVMRICDDLAVLIAKGCGSSELAGGEKSEIGRHRR